MRLRTLSEMPMRGGSFRKDSDAFVGTKIELFRSLPNVAKVDDYTLRGDVGHGISLWYNDDKMVAYAKLTKLTSSSVEIDDIWISVEETGKKLLSKMLWFIKTRMNFKTIQFGSYHSIETQNIIAAGGFSLFDKYWVNHETGVKVKLDLDEIDKYYQSHRWKFVIENKDEELENWPLIMTRETGFTRMSYGFDI